MPEERRAEALRAAAALVRAFAAHDTDGYFACFAPEATFTFHTVPEQLRSRAAYQQLWRTWEEQDGFRVVACSSSDQDVQLAGAEEDVAVFTHRVRTRVATHEGSESLDERETIVFQRQRDGRWLAIHEHLSPSPTPPEGGNGQAAPGDDAVA